MLSWLKSKGCKYGKIATLPDVPGVLLFSPGHVGVYVGGGYAVEARGFNYGVVKTKVANRSWTTWAYLPASLLEYDLGADDVVDDKPSGGEVPEAKRVLGERLLKRGTKGNDVTQLQEYLVKLGYDLGTYGSARNGVDGDFGSKTEEAVKGFQKANGLEVDGEYGKRTHAALLEAVKTPGTASEEKTFSIKVNGGSVNVRNAPDTKTGKVMRVVRMNAVLTAVGTDPETGWYKLSDGNYISNKYASRM